VYTERENHCNDLPDGVESIHPVHAGRISGMKTYQSELSALPCAVASVIVILVSVAMAADEPSATPTPRPRKLGDVKLKTGETQRVVISDANLAELADRGTVTVGGTATSKPAKGKPRQTPSRKDRERWRKKVLDQKGVIAGLERKRLRIEAQIDLIEDGRLSIRALARIQRAEVDLRAVEREIRTEKAELGRLIREARRHGAEPGWFR
jgi:predicted amino acid-binding ACT domain protein